MGNAQSSPHENRVLLLAPTTRDAAAAAQIFSSIGFSFLVCANLAELCREIGQGAGVVIVPDEIILKDHEGCLTRMLGDQPPWSDLPLIVLTPPQGLTPRASTVLESLGHMTPVRRPVEIRGFASTIRTALRDRARQYAARDHFLEREFLLAEARRAKEDADAANRMKDEFLATLSHELRTPLNAILGWARILRMGTVDPEDLQEGISAIERNSTAQAQIIEDLLDVSRIIAGKFRLDVQTVNVHEVIESALTSVLPAATARGVRVQKVLDSLAGPVSGDAARLQQIVWNLLSNAVKFTPQGGKVRVLLERVNSHVEVSVVDTGMGIKPEFLPHVFDRFRQADGSSTRRHGGLGLGLAIVKQLVEMHGGTVRAKSPGEGQGATFTVALPIMVVQPQQPEKTPPTRKDSSDFDCKAGNLDGVRVLVVDDELDARRLIERVLAECGAQVALACSAAEALMLLDAFKPHVLLSDVGMPEQDGYDLLRSVRGRGKTSAEIPAAALTAFARSEDRRRAMLAGFQTHVAKPVDPAELLAVVASLAGRTGTD